MRYDSRVSGRSNQVKVVLYLGREAWIKAKVGMEFWFGFGF